MLQIHEGQHKELQTLRQYIAACFEELECFLMPHPGLSVATNPEFNGNLKGRYNNTGRYSKSMFFFSVKSCLSVIAETNRNVFSEARLAQNSFIYHSDSSTYTEHNNYLSFSNRNK